MEAPNTIGVWRTGGTCDKDVERGEVGCRVAIAGREEIVRRQASGVEGSMVRSKTANRLGILCLSV